MPGGHNSLCLQEAQTLVNSPPREVSRLSKPLTTTQYPHLPKLLSPRCQLATSYLALAVVYPSSLDCQETTKHPLPGINHFPFKRSFRNLLCSISLMDHIHILHSSSLPECLHKVMNHAQKWPEVLFT